MVLGLDLMVRLILLGLTGLELKKERTKNPAGVGRSSYIMQANQLSGYVNITKEKNGGFEDQA